MFNVFSVTTTEDARTSIHTGQHMDLHPSQTMPPGRIDVEYWSCARQSTLQREVISTCCSTQFLIESESKAV